MPQPCSCFPGSRWNPGETPVVDTLQVWKRILGRKVDQWNQPVRQEGIFVAPNLRWDFLMKSKRKLEEFHLRDFLAWIWFCYSRYFATNNRFYIIELCVRNCTYVYIYILLIGWSVLVATWLVTEMILDKDAVFFFLFLLFLLVLPAHHRAVTRSKVIWITMFSAKWLFGG